MSKFIDSAIFMKTNKRYPVYNNLCITFSNINPISTPVHYLNEYNLIAGYNIYFRTEESNLEHGKNNALKQLTYAIYGEFYKDLLTLDRYIYGQEYSKAKQLIDKIIKNINL